MCYFSGLESQLPGVSPLTIEQLELTAKNEVPVRTSSEDSMVSQQSGESNPIDSNQSDVEQSGKCIFLYKF